MKDTIDMAREAFSIVKGESWNSGFWTVAHEELQAFEALVRADERAEAATKLEQRVKEAYQDGHTAGAKSEREACAKVCESLFDMDDDSCSEAEQCAAAIRARGNT